MEDYKLDQNPVKLTTVRQKNDPSEVTNLRMLTPRHHSSDKFRKASSEEKSLLMERTCTSRWGKGMVI